MDFQLSEDQLALRKAADELLASRSSPRTVRAVVDAGGGWDRELWAALVEQGWPGVAVAEVDGGVGLGWVEVAVLCEAVGAHLAPAPILGQLVAASALAEASSPLLAGVVTGEAIAAVGFRELSARHDDGDGWRLWGRTEPIAFAPSAGLLVVPGRDESGDPHLFAVSHDEASRPAAVPAMDVTRELAPVELDATSAMRLGGPDAVEAHLDRGAVAHAAELLGLAAHGLEMAVGYAGERVQFGRPIGSFQAVKHRCADMLVDVEGMRSAVWWAAWCLSAGDPEAHVASSVAKSWCSDAADRVLQSTLQVHGGIGFTWECDVHLHLKRAQLDRVAFGDAPYHRERLAGLLRERVASGAGVI